MNQSVDEWGAYLTERAAARDSFINGLKMNDAETRRLGRQISRLRAMKGDMGGNLSIGAGDSPQEFVREGHEYAYVRGNTMGACKDVSVSFHAVYQPFLSSRLMFGAEVYTEAQKPLCPANAAIGEWMRDNAAAIKSIAKSDSLDDACTLIFPHDIYYRQGTGYFYSLSREDRKSPWTQRFMRVKESAASSFYFVIHK